MVVVMEGLQNKPEICPGCNGPSGEKRSCPVIARLNPEKGEKFACVCCRCCRAKCEEELP